MSLTVYASLNGWTGRLVQILVAALAMGLIALIGLDATSAVNATSFLLSVICITALPIPSHAVSDKRNDSALQCSLF